MSDCICWRGCKFASLLHAQWAVFFECLGIEWEYEPEVFETYRPTFLVHDVSIGDVFSRNRNVYVDVRESWEDDDISELDKLSKLRPVYRGGKFQTDITGFRAEHDRSHAFNYHTKDGKDEYALLTVKENGMGGIVFMDHDSRHDMWNAPMGMALQAVLAFNDGKDPDDTRIRRCRTAVMIARGDYREAVSTYTELSESLTFHETDVLEEVVSKLTGIARRHPNFDFEVHGCPDGNGCVNVTAINPPLWPYATACLFSKTDGVFRNCSESEMLSCWENNDAVYRRTQELASVEDLV